MQFKTDENLPAEVAEMMRQHGHDALSVNDQALMGETDKRLFSICCQEFRVLITLDTDFADIRTYPPSSSSGLIVLRLPRQDKSAVLKVVQRLLPLLEQEPLNQRLWIVDERRLRIRE